MHIIRIVRRMLVLSNTGMLSIVSEKHISIYCVKNKGVL
jgi:hypothetical protein